MSEVITVKNVRLSFAQIFTPKAYMEGQKAKYSCNLLLDKDDQSDQITKLKKAIKAKADEAFNGKPPKGLKTCLGDGEEKAYDGYDNAVFVSCSTLRRPQVLDRDKTPLVEEDGRPYSGCYVNAAISFWAQDNQFGKRINCNLVGVQFVKDGDTFGSGAPSVDKLFDDISDEQDADAAEDDFL